MKRFEFSGAFAKTLTTGVDTLTGTNGGDTFIADNSVIDNNVTSAADTINGGAGNDTLKVFLKSGSAIALNIPALTSVENLYLNGGALTGTTALNVASIAGLTSLTIDSATGVAPTYTLAGQAVTLQNMAGATAQTFTLASSSDTVENVTVSALGTTNAATIDISGSKAATVNVVSAGTLTATQANTVVLTDTGTAATAVTVSGASTLNLTVGNTAAVPGFAATGIASIDASAATGTTTITVIGTAVAAQNNLNTAFSYKGGSGADTLDLTNGFVGGTALTAALLNKMTINGGAGINTLILGNSIVTGTTAITSLTNEQIIGDTNASGTVNMANFAGATGFKLLGTDTAALTVSALASAGTFDLGTSADGGFTTTVNAIGTGTADTLGMTLGSAGAALGANTGALLVSGYETITVLSQGAANTIGAGGVTFSASAGGTETVNLTLSKALTFAGAVTLTGNSQTLNIAGSGALTVTGVLTANTVVDTGTGAFTATAANKVLSFDASANTAAVSFNDSAATGAASLKFGSGNSTVVGSGFADVISVGSGTNSINGGLGGDTISIAHGALTNVDTLLYSAIGQTGAAISANGSLSGVDIVTGVAKGDKIDVSAFAPTLTSVTQETAFSGTEVAGTNAAMFMVRGNYNVNTGAFAASAAGTDSLVEYDNNGTSSTGVMEAIVLIGYVNAGTTAVAAGVLTLG